MEILLWLLPAAAATLLAMGWVSWWGREGRGEVDRDTAARRLGEALSQDRGARPGYAVAPRRADHSSGVALRPSRMRPVVLPGAQAPAVPVEPTGEPTEEPTEVSAQERAARDRRAS